MRHARARRNSHVNGSMLCKHVRHAPCRGQTPLHFAASARKRTKDICEMLLARGASKDIMDATGRVPYELADADEIRTLLGGPDGR